MMMSSAIKIKAEGRASGGLIIFLKKYIFNVLLIEKLDHWIFIKIEILDVSFILGIVYFRYSFEINYLLELFDTTSKEIKYTYDEYPLFIGGDFNCRVSDYNQGDENIFRGTNLDYLMYSYDKIVNIGDKFCYSKWKQTSTN